MTPEEKIKNFVAEIANNPKFLSAPGELFAEGAKPIEIALHEVRRLADENSDLIEVFDKLPNAIANKRAPLKQRFIDVSTLLTEARDLSCGRMIN